MEEKVKNKGILQDFSLLHALGFAPKANKLEQAKRLLRKLAETNNAIQSNESFNLAEEQNISRRTLENAKKELGVRAKRINNSWYWELNKVRTD